MKVHDDFDLTKTVDEKKALKVAKEKFETETIKVSYVKILDTIYTTYAMPEDSLDWAYDSPYGQLRAGEVVGDNSAIDTGHWYDFCAASAGELCNPPQAQHATQDICPKSWRLPDGTESIYDTKYLAAFVPVTGGYYRYTDEFEDTDQGFWWLSSARTGSSQYMLHYDGSQLTRMYGTAVGGRELGYYIRCIRPSDD